MHRPKNMLGGAYAPPTALFKAWTPLFALVSFGKQCSYILLLLNALRGMSRRREIPPSLY